MTCTFPASERAGSTPTPFAYNGGSGYQSDPDTGLMLLGHRYYDPTIGRFLSRDPAGGGENWYAYCDNDPINGSAPSGLDSFARNPGGSYMHDTGGHFVPAADDGSILANPTLSYARKGSEFSSFYGQVQIGGQAGGWSFINGTGINPFHVEQSSINSLWHAAKINLPENPAGLPTGWTQNTNHRNPKGQQWINPEGKGGLEWHPKQPEAPTGTWRAKDHWHILRPSNYSGVFE